MTGQLQMIINGKVELSKSVHSNIYMERVIRDWKEKMLPALKVSDSWEIVLRTFSTFGK